MSAWTEQDAKALWCPLSRVADVNLGGSTNRPDCGTSCLASGCMMWRWLDPEEREVFSVPGKPDRTKDQIKYPLTGRDQSGSWFKRDVKDRRGYCGLAGTRGLSFAGTP